LHYGSGRTAQVSVGVDTPIGASRYAQIEGRDKLYIVPATLRTSLWQEPDKLRLKNLAKFEETDVQGVTVQTPEERVSVVRAGEGDEPRWDLTEPLQTRGDEWNSKQLITKLKDMRAEGFVIEERSDADLGMDKPQVTLTLALRDRDDLTVTVGSQTKQSTDGSAPEMDVLFVRSSERSEVLLVKADVLEGLVKTAFDLRDKSVVQLDRDEVLRLKVESKQGLNFSVARRPAGWIVEKPNVAEASQSKIDNLLWDIEDLSAKSYVTEEATDQDLRGCGLMVPSAVLTVTLRGEDTPIKVYMGDATEDGDYYCMTDQSKRVVTISRFLVDDLPQKAEDLEASATDMTPQSPMPMPPAEAPM